MRGNSLLKYLIPFFLVIGFLSSLLADGFIIIDPPYPVPPRPQPFRVQPFPLHVKVHHVKVNIRDQIAETHIEQTIYNPTDARLEGYYLFPVPRNAQVTQFSIFIDGKLQKAELLDAVKARKTYEDIVRRMRDPAVLEYNDQQVLKLRIFPFQPREEKKITLTYTEELQKDNGTTEYLYPLNTEKFSSALLEEVNISVELHSQAPITNIYCPTHQVDISQPDAHQAIITYEASDVKPATDFRLFFHTEDRGAGLSVLTFRQGKEAGYFFLSFGPGKWKESRESLPKDIVFVLDVSGSMAGEKIKQAKAALSFCINNLHPGDRFDVISFSTGADALFKEVSPATEKRRKRALAFLDSLNAIGGTNIEEALKLAFQGAGKETRPFFIVFITDGKPTVGVTDENELLNTIGNANTAHTRIFTIGIGYNINTHLLDKLTEMTNAYRTYISPDEGIELKISNFYRKVANPILTDLEVEFDEGLNVSEIYPRRLPDVFRGSTLTILGRYRGNGKHNVTIRGMAAGKTKSFSYRVNFPEQAEAYPFVPTLWAARAVGYLLDQIRLHGETKELKDEIVHLARRYGIVTPYTSYLIVQDEEERVARQEISPEDRIIGENMREDRVFMESAGRAFEGLQMKSGAMSVGSSVEAQDLGSAAGLGGIRQKQAAVRYRGPGGKEVTLNNRIKFLNGRAFYFTGRFWVDSQLAEHPRAEVRRIQFGSEEYFRFLKTNPSAARILALGKNIRFVWQDKVIEVVE